MPSIKKIHTKSGLSFKITVSCGYDERYRKRCHYKTWKAPENWSEQRAEREAQKIAYEFENSIKLGFQPDNNKTFAEYAAYVIDLKEHTGTKHSTIELYKHLCERIIPAIGHIKLKDLRADHLNSFYTALGKPGQNKRTGSGLSAKTILEHHRLISTVLDQAEKEGQVPFNVAAKATLPKVAKKEVNYFQPEQIAAIRDALKQEPLKWETLTHLFLLTGARRGELLGLKWSAVDFEKNRVHICNNVLYAPDRGIYEDTPKTATSDRYITLPAETMQLLRTYRAWQNTERLRLGEFYENQGFVFSQENGSPMHPDSATDWMSKFSKRHGLPHINPHAFRHTMASMLYFNGVDSVSISKRLGHAQVSTTANIYAHVVEEADRKNAEILSDIFLKKA